MILPNEIMLQILKNTPDIQVLKKLYNDSISIAQICNQYREEILTYIYKNQGLLLIDICIIYIQQNYLQGIKYLVKSGLYICSDNNYLLRFSSE
jgi:hypothetical protein